MPRTAQGDTVKSEALNSGKCLKIVRCIFCLFLEMKVGWHSGRQPKNKEPTVKQIRKGRQNGTYTENKYNTKNIKTPECLEIINKQSKRNTHAKERQEYHNTGETHKGGTIVIAGNSMIVGRRSGDEVCKPQ